MGTKELSAKMKEYKELQRLIEEAEAEMEAIKDEIKEEMKARSVDELTADVFKATWKPVKSSRIDTTALKKAMPEIAQQFTKQTETQRFTIS